MRITIAKSLLGIGVASSLFLGCQQLAGREDASGGNPGGSADAGAASEFDLALRVKPTEECLALKELLAAADSAGDTSLTLEGDFVKLCLEEVKPGPDGAIRIPPGLVPPKPSRCKWLVAQVDSGNSEYIVKLLYHCPEKCDTALADSVPGHCPVPRPKPDCPSLIAKFDTLDTASKEYARLKHFLHHHCGVIDPDHPKPPVHDSLLPPPPPKDTLHPRPPRVPTLCDTIHVNLAGLDKASDEYAALKAQHDSVCHIPPPPKDSLTPPPPPKDTLPPRVPTHCDTLHKALAGLDTASAGYAALKAEHDSVCHIPRPPKDTLAPPPPPKDTLPPPPPPAKDSLNPPPPPKDTLTPPPPPKDTLPPAVP